MSALQQSIISELEQLKAINKDFYPSQYAAQEAVLASLIASVDDMTTGTGTFDSTTSVTVNAEVGTLSFSSSFVNTVAFSTPLTFVLTNSFASSSTPVFFACNNTTNNVGLDAWSFAKASGSITGKLASSTAATVAISAVTIDFYVATGRASN